MKVFSVLGYSGSGKTTTIEYIIKELQRREYTVGTIKEIHYKKFSMDRDGTNTSRHKNAGAQVVTARGLNETDILFPFRLPVDDILRFYNHDFVIMEGVADYNAPKIICARTADEINEIKDSSVFAISGVMSNSIKNYGDLPVFNPLKDVVSLVDLIEEKIAAGSSEVD